MAMVEIFKIGDQSIQIAEQFINLGIIGICLYGVFFFLILSFVIYFTIKFFRNWNNFDKKFKRY